MSRVRIEGVHFILPFIGKHDAEALFYRRVVTEDEKWRFSSITAPRKTSLLR
ncbi:hypothetical protein [Haloferax larsenii]|uniref:hypothetical protein n=1 Tax=Haloferax larsenii TaxID=302484 RepID=UPI00147DF9B7|nr:hypothetical protein [Haloferax larsenii]